MNGPIRARSGGVLSRPLKEALKAQDAAAALSAFHDHKPCLSACNAVLSLLADRPAEVRRVREQMQAHGIRPDETTATLCAKAATTDGDAEGAIALLQEARDSGIALRPRSYRDALRLLFERHDLAGVLALLQSWREDGLAPSEAEWVMAARLSIEAEDWQGLDQLLRELRDAVSTLSPASIDALASPRRATAGGAAAPTSPTPRTRPAVRLASVDGGGLCSACGAQLEPCSLSPEHEAAVRRALFEAAAAAGPAVKADLHAFGEWLVGRARAEPTAPDATASSAAPAGAPTFIMDAANVGYRNQNVEGGAFSFVQIEVARRALRERRGAEPVLVLPRRYLARAVPNHNMCAKDRRWRAPKRSRSKPKAAGPPGADEMLVSTTPAERELVAGWREAGALWSTPDYADDDWYWTYPWAGPFLPAPSTPMRRGGLMTARRTDDGGAPLRIFTSSQVRGDVARAACARAEQRRASRPHAGRGARPSALQKVEGAAAGQVRRRAHFHSAGALDDVWLGEVFRLVDGRIPRL
jgi:hypothetical protein